MQTTGQRIYWLRRTHGLNVHELAERVGTSSGTISKLERDERPQVSASVVSRIATVLDTTTDYLNGRTNDPCTPMIGYSRTHEPQRPAQDPRR